MASLASASAPASKVKTTAEQQSIVYAASLNLTVPNAASAIENVKQIAAELGGHLQSLARSQIIIRVPVLHGNQRIFDGTPQWRKLLR